ncbi:MAG TPA: hypothetical protein DCQ06_05780 [Myxococcales bacterium]|nr:hypothetical protein [Myxococcales bacterium]HAN31090.1 hypothetical protein [Myxococcales bacterium]
MSTLATLIADAGHGYARWDRDFVRALAGTLADHSDRLCLPAIDKLGLLDVALTFHLNENVHVVVTGMLEGVPGEVTIRWSAQQLAEVEANFKGRAANQPAYLVCTLDFCDAGRWATVIKPDMGLAQQERVQIRARVTVGQRQTWRLKDRSVSLSALQLDPVGHQ